MKQFESFVLDTSNECLWHESVQIALANKLFAVLRFMVENPGRLITHHELLDAIWPTTYVQPQVLRTYVLELRKILGDDPKHPKFIQTLPKRGYRFVATVTDITAAELETAGAPEIATKKANFTGLVGRNEDLDRLQQLAQLAEGGQRQLVFITGPAGIGKTALINGLRETLNVTLPKARIVLGHCVEGLSNKEDYYPIVEAFGQFRASTDQVNLESPWQRTFQNRPGELCEAIEISAQENVFILVIEDIQWAHESTLELVSALARRETPVKLMVIATYRSQDRSTGLCLKSIKQDLLVRHLCTELSLAPLSKPALRQLLSRRLEQERLPAELDSFIYQRSGGNPLLVLALLDHMLAERFLVRKGANNEGEWGQLSSVAEMEISVPGELATLIELEIDRLSPKEQRVLEAGSLMQIAFPVWAVAAALEDDQESIEETCEDLERRTGLVRRAGHDDLPDGTRADFYSFAHEFYREVLYERQTTGRRAGRHIRIAERLRSLFAGREANVAQEMTMHFEAAGNWSQAARTLRAAARHAHQRCAYQQSAELLERALRIVESSADAECSVVAREIENELERVREMIAGTRPQRKQAEDLTFFGRGLDDYIFEDR
jgi:predicted ATPase/DNA-binding winged helix-turn-helix (wHTH) protein